MSELVNNIWKESAYQAANPGRPARVINWGHAKWHKITKPRNIVKTGTTIATGFVSLPIPLWTSTVDFIIAKTEAKIRDHYRGKKLGEVDTNNVVKQVKHGIKNLDISRLDRSRYKVQHGWSRLDKFVREKDKSVSRCVGIYQYALHFHYMRRRTAKLRTQAEVMRKLSKAIIEWCDKLESQLDVLADPIKQGIEDRLDHKPDECGGVGAKAGCFNGSSGSKSLADAVSKFTELSDLG